MPKQKDFFDATHTIMTQIKNNNDPPTVVVDYDNQRDDVCNNDGTNNNAVPRSILNFRKVVVISILLLSTATFLKIRNNFYLSAPTTTTTTRGRGRTFPTRTSQTTTRTNRRRINVLHRIYTNDGIPKGIRTSYRNRTTRITEQQQQQSQEQDYSTSPRRIAIVRPFASKSVDLHLSFDTWDRYPPCDVSKISAPAAPSVSNNDTQRSNNNDDVIVDVLISFSQSYATSPDATLSFELISGKFKSESTLWRRCFGNIYAIEANISPEGDTYMPRAADKDVMWVNGPNRQFVSSFRSIRELGYEGMFLMESDSVPVKEFWMDVFLAEVEEKRPFGILGSKYDGYSWDEFRDQLPLSLVHHINGNAMYNASHPLINLIIDEIEEEAKTVYNSIPFDYRISQIVYEGSHGIAPQINRKFLPDDRDQRKRLLSSNAERFARWWDEYGGNEPIKESNVLSNFATTNLLPKHMNDAYIIHGAQHFSSWDSSLHNITLVISDWYENLSSYILSQLDTNEHPFSNVLLILPSNVNVKKHLQSPLPTSIPFHTFQRTHPEYMDICDAPISTEWFVITNAYHGIAPSVDYLFTLDSKKPVVPYTPADERHCFAYPGCEATFVLATMIDPTVRMVVRDHDMIFRTSHRDDFCNEWREQNGRIGEYLFDDMMDTTLSSWSLSPFTPRGPTASSFVAWLTSKVIAEELYYFSDRTVFGARDNFVKVFFEEETNSRYRMMQIDRRLQMASPSNSQITSSPTKAPRSLPPTVARSLSPTVARSLSPTLLPTPSPTLPPTLSPTLSPTVSPATSSKFNTCKDWCATLPIRDTVKCKWQFSCSGCEVCRSKRPRYCTTVCALQSFFQENIIIQCECDENQ